MNPLNLNNTPTTNNHTPRGDDDMNTVDLATSSTQPVIPTPSITNQTNTDGINNPLTPLQFSWLTYSLMLKYLKQHNAGTPHDKTACMNKYNRHITTCICTVDTDPTVLQHIRGVQVQMAARSVNNGQPPSITQQFLSQYYNNRTTDADSDDDDSKSNGYDSAVEFIQPPTRTVNVNPQNVQQQLTNHYGVGATLPQPPTVQVNNNHRRRAVNHIPPVNTGTTYHDAGNDHIDANGLPPHLQSLFNPPAVSVYQQACQKLEVDVLVFPGMHRSLMGDWNMYQSQHITPALYPNDAHLLELSHHIFNIKQLAARTDTNAEALAICECSLLRILQYSLVRVNKNWASVRGMTPPILRVGGGVDLLDSASLQYIQKMNAQYVSVHGSGTSYNKSNKTSASSTDNPRSNNQRKPKRNNNHTGTSASTTTVSGAGSQ